MRIDISFWGVFGFLVKTFVIGLPALSWLFYLYFMGGQFVAGSAGQKFLLIFVVIVLTLPVPAIFWSLYNESSRLEEWVKDLLQKEGVSYQGVPIRVMGGLVRRRFPNLTPVVGKFGWWLLSFVLPWTLMFHFGAGTAFSR